MHWQQVTQFLLRYCWWSNRILCNVLKLVSLPSPRENLLFWLEDSGLITLGQIKFVLPLCPLYSILAQAPLMNWLWNVTQAKLTCILISTSMELAMALHGSIVMKLNNSGDCPFKVQFKVGLRWVWIQYILGQSCYLSCCPKDFLHGFSCKICAQL